MNPNSEEFFWEYGVFPNMLCFDLSKAYYTLTDLENNLNPTPDIEINQHWDDNNIEWLKWFNKNDGSYTPLGWVMRLIPRDKKLPDQECQEVYNSQQSLVDD